MNNSRFKIRLSVMVLAAILTSIVVISFTPDNRIRTGADQPELYLPKLAGKNVALVANQTTVLLPSKEHLADFLLEKNVRLTKIFAPEHGFRGDHAAGAEVQNGKDVKTGLPLVSLYGDNKKPTKEQLNDVAIIIFDIQDVGARFYTYISTMHYVMQAAAESGVEVMILDRPNPHGNYIDGPILKPGFESFVGMHQIPVIHGMTIGEYAKMINGEGWLGDGLSCKLTVIPISGWNRATPYSLPIPPSPNLPNDISIKLYPSLCFFEGTPVSVGRGTECPFQAYGHPDLSGSYSFIPKSIAGVADHPKMENKTCRGTDLRLVTSVKSPADKLDLSFLLTAYGELKLGEAFFTSFFDKLAGSDVLRTQILSGMTEEQIRESWKPDLERFADTRSKYLLYR